MEMRSKEKIERVRKLRAKEGLLMNTISTTQGMLNSSDRLSPNGLTVVRVEGKSFIVPGSIAIEGLRVIDDYAQKELGKVSIEIKEQVEL